MAADQVIVRGSKSGAVVEDGSREAAVGFPQRPTKIRD